MVALPYREYVQKRVTRDAVTVAHDTPGSEGLKLYAGLSPFDVPDSVTVMILGSNVCQFEFSYANAEPPESSWRVATEDGVVSALLGKNTRKILALRIQDASQRLRGSSVLDAGRIQSWAAELPAHAFNTCLRNGQVVRSIVETIPSAYKKEIFRALAETDRTP